MQPEAPSDEAPLEPVPNSEPPYELTDGPRQFPCEIIVYRNMIPITWPECLTIYEGYSKTPQLRSNGTEYLGPADMLVMGYDNRMQQRGPWANLYVWLERNGIWIGERRLTEVFLPEFKHPNWVHFPPTIEQMYQSTFGNGGVPKLLGQYSVSIRGTRRGEGVS